MDTDFKPVSSYSYPQITSFEEWVFWSQDLDLAFIHDIRRDNQVYRWNARLEDFYPAGTKRGNPRYVRASGVASTREEAITKGKDFKDTLLELLKKVS